MRSIRALLALVLIGVLAFSAVGCSDKNVAARVNGEAITIEELDKQVEQLKEQYPDMFEGPDGEGRLIDFKQRLLDNLINQELVRQAAEEQGVEVSQSDVDGQLETLRAGFQDEAQFEQAIESAGMTTETLEDQIREQLLTSKLIESLTPDTDIADSDIAEYYEKNKQQFYQEDAKRTSHILFKPEDKAQAEKVLAELEDGGDFASLAKEYSVDTATASKGGDLGWPSTPFVAEFQAAIDALDKGETSALVQTPYGWHIIRVTDERTGSQQELEEVTDQIREILIQQRRADAYQEFLDELREAAEIEILLDELKAAVPSASQETTSN
jgi:parvulin-like peptidyl-prolyl isomerase